MQYEVNVREFANTKLAVGVPGVFSNPRLLVNGQPATAGQKKGEFLLVRDDGSVVTAKFKPNFLDAVPKLEVDGETIELVEPLAWYQWAWSCLPLVLLFLGGCIGGALGGAAVYFNSRIFRSHMPVAAQYLVTGLISGGAVVCYLVAVALLQLVLPKK